MTPRALASGIVTVAATLSLIGCDRDSMATGRREPKPRDPAAKAYVGAWFAMVRRFP